MRVHTTMGTSYVNARKITNVNIFGFDFWERFGNKPSTSFRLRRDDKLWSCDVVISCKNSVFGNRYWTPNSTLTINFHFSSLLNCYYSKQICQHCLNEQKALSISLSFYHRIKVENITPCMNVTISIENATAFTFNIKSSPVWGKWMC